MFIIFIRTCNKFTLKEFYKLDRTVINNLLNLIYF
jgi:hypothetical protein